MKKLRPALILTFACFASGAMAQTETNAPSSNTLVIQSETGGLQVADRTDNERIVFLLNVASVYFKNGNYQAAIDAYERVLEINPENKQARFILSQVYGSAKQYAKAEFIMKRLIEEFPEDFQVKNNLAWLYATAEDPRVRDGEKAIKLAQEAMVLAPYDHHIWSTLAEAYYVTGQYEKAYRAITHMASLAARYGTNITEEMVEGYNEQILRCKRAWDSEKALNELEDSEKGSTKEQPEQAALDD